MSKRRFARLQRSRERWLASYVVRRLLSLTVLLAIVSLLVFSLLYISPGDPVTTLLGDTPRTEETVRAVREEYHLDDSYWTRYWDWVKGASHFDFGKSIRTTLPVSDSFERTLPVSLFLGFYAFILSMLFGLTLGVWSALRKNTFIDRGIVAGAILGLSTPVFVAGIYLLYLFSVVLGWFPTFGAGLGFSDRL